MASCATDVRTSGTAPIGGLGSGRICRAAFHSCGDAPNLGQWTTTDARAGDRASRGRRRSVPTAARTRATPPLAQELGVHIRTLQAAAPTGRLEARFSVRSAFGRPIRRASRAAGEQFLAKHYRRFSGQAVCPVPLPTVPSNYDQRLRDVRQRLRLTQAAMARRIGAAGKAVVYQWESRKRTPSPVLWQRVMELDQAGGDGRRRGLAHRRRAS